MAESAYHDSLIANRILPIACRQCKTTARYAIDATRYAICDQRYTIRDMLSTRNPPSEAVPSFVQPGTVEHLDRWRIWTGPLRVLPDFLILGAQKAGTTSLFDALSLHPDIVPALAKEVHFFDYNYWRGEAWYRAHYPTRMQKLRGLFRATGEGSPYYLFYPHAAWRVKDLTPHAKLIVLLRNPVERAYSHYHHQVRFGVEPLTFEEALDQEPARLAGEYEKLVSDSAYYSFNYQNYSYLARGMYADQLARWFKYLPRDQFLILSSESFYKNTAREFERVLDFIRVPHWQPPEFRRSNEGTYNPMNPATRARLIEFFAPHNARLYELLNIDFGWE